MSELLLEVKDLRVSFKTYAGLVQAVRGVNFTLNKGETLAIVGESGSGKSVTANALMRLIPEPPGQYDAGEVLLNGDNILDKTEEEMTKIRGNDIAMIFQDPMTALNPTIRIGKQIVEAIRIHDKTISRQAAEKRDYHNDGKCRKRSSNFRRSFGGNGPLARRKRNLFRVICGGGSVNPCDGRIRGDINPY